MGKGTGFFGRGKNDVKRGETGFCVMDQGSKKVDKRCVKRDVELQRTYLKNPSANMGTSMTGLIKVDSQLFFEPLGFCSAGEVKLWLQHEVDAPRRRRKGMAF